MSLGRSPATVARACPVCRATAREPLFDNLMAPLDGFDMSYVVCECGGCGFVFAGELPPSPQYEEYYGRFSKYDHPGAISAMDLRRGQAALDVAREVVGVDAKVIDIGCGSGALLSLFQEAGFAHLHGIDPAPNAPTRAKELFGLAGIRRGTLSDCHVVAPVGDADLVMIMAVLEHLWDPLGDLTSVFAHLRPGTRVMVEVPALETFDGSHGEPFGELSLEHIQYFSRASLDALMAAAGASPVANRFVELDETGGQALLALYEISRTPATATKLKSESLWMRDYLAASAERLEAAVDRVPLRELIVYGAGSHTARLLPVLSDRGTKVKFLVDANPNLRGVSMGGCSIASPTQIAAHPALPVLISSYRFQAEIQQRLSGHYPNELVTLY